MALGFWIATLGGLPVVEHPLTIDWWEWLKVTGSFAAVLAGTIFVFQPLFDRLIFNAWKRRRADVREALDEMYTVELRKLIDAGVHNMSAAVDRLADLVDRIDARSEQTSATAIHVAGQVETLLRERGLPVTPYTGPERRDPHNDGGRRAADKINPIPAIIAEAKTHE